MSQKTTPDSPEEPLSVDVVHDGTGVKILFNMSVKWVRFNTRESALEFARRVQAVALALDSPLEGVDATPPASVN